MVATAGLVGSLFGNDHRLPQDAASSKTTIRLIQHTEPIADEARRGEAEKSGPTLAAPTGRPALLPAATVSRETIHRPATSLTDSLTKLVRDDAPTRLTLSVSGPPRHASNARGTQLTLRPATSSPQSMTVGNENDGRPDEDHSQARSDTRPHVVFGTTRSMNRESTELEVVTFGGGAAISTQRRNRLREPVDQDRMQLTIAASELGRTSGRSRVETVWSDAKAEGVAAQLAPNRDRVLSTSFDRTDAPSLAESPQGQFDNTATLSRLPSDVSSVSTESLPEQVPNRLPPEQLGGTMEPISGGFMPRSPEVASQTDRIGPFDVMNRIDELSVISRDNKLLRASVDVARVAVVDRDVCEVVQFSARELSVIGKRPGMTHLTVWFDVVNPQTGPVRPVTLAVRVVDDYHLAKRREAKRVSINVELARRFPESRVEVVSDGGQWALRGYVHDAARGAEILAFVREKASEQKATGVSGAAAITPTAAIEPGNGVNGTPSDRDMPQPLPATDGVPRSLLTDQVHSRMPPARVVETLEVGWPR